MYQSNRSLNIPPGQPPGHLNFRKIFVQIPHSRGRKAVQMPHHKSIPGDQMHPPLGNFSVVSIMLRKLCMFFVFGRMSSPPVGLVQWLSDITSNPNRDWRAMSHEGFTQKRRGTKPPTSPRDRNSPPQIKTKKQKVPKGAKAHTTETSNLRSRPTKDTKRKEATER